MRTKRLIKYDYSYNKAGDSIDEAVRESLRGILRKHPKAEPADLWQIVMSAASMVLEGHEMNVAEAIRASLRRARSKAKRVR